ncbi:hypothetical protein EX30DRAFT_342178, partial [Ascodesmis nigricans]
MDMKPDKHMDVQLDKPYRCLSVYCSNGTYRVIEVATAKCDGCNLTTKKLKKSLILRCELCAHQSCVSCQND